MLPRTAPLHPTTVALFCAAAFVLIGDPAPPTSSAAETEARADGPRTVRIEAAEGPIEGVSVSAWLGETRVSTFVGALPAELAFPPGVALTLSFEVAGRIRAAAPLAAEDTHLEIHLVRASAVGGQVVDERGTPVSGAIVRTSIAEALPWQRWNTTTDAEGRFSFDTMPVASASVHVEARGHSPLTRTEVDPTPNLLLALERVATLAGRVVRPDGFAAPLADVVVVGSAIWPGVHVPVREDGSFRLDGVPAGVYEVHARNEGLLAPPRRGITIEPASRCFLTLSLAAGSTVSGIIRDAATGEGIPGADLLLSTGGLGLAPRSAISQADGRFRVLGLEASAHFVTVEAVGYVPVRALAVTPGESVSISLERGATLSGRVVDSAGQPVAGAQIEVVGEDPARQPVMLGAAEGFRSSLLETHLLLLPPMDGPVPPIPGGDPSLGGESLGVVPPLATEHDIELRYQSAEDGTFEIPGVPSGHVQVTARLEGYAPATTDRIFVTRGGRRDDLTLVLTTAGTLHGEVVDGRGWGIAAIPVEVRSDRDPDPRVVFTDERGAFALAGVVGELTVTALPLDRPAARGRAEVVSGRTTELRLVVEGSLETLAGRVVDERGFPLASVPITLASLRSDAPLQRVVLSEADGTFVSSALPSPPWRLSADAPGYARTVLDVFEPTERATLRLEPGITVTGQVLDDLSGEGVPARVTLILDGLPPEIHEANTFEDGAFAFDRVRRGSWRLTARSDTHVEVERPLSIAGVHLRDAALDPIRLRPCALMQGTVVDALGTPLAGARVFAEDEPDRGVETDADGQFVLPTPAGETHLIAEHPASGSGELSARGLSARETPGLVIRLDERFDPERAAALPGRQRGVALEVQGGAGGVVIARVIPGSRAERAGLRVGDRLAEIDGDVPSGAAHAIGLLRGSPSVPAILRVERGELSTLLIVEREIWLPD